MSLAKILKDEHLFPHVSSCFKHRLSDHQWLEPHDPVWPSGYSNDPEDLEADRDTPPREAHSGYHSGIENESQVLSRMQAESPAYPPDVEVDSKDMPQSEAVLSLLFPKSGKPVLQTSTGAALTFESLCQMGMQHLLVCGFFVPYFCRDWYLDTVSAVSLAASELYRSKGRNFQMVIVVKMRRDWANNEAAFNQFLSGFPKEALVVPFSNDIARDHLCKLLGLSSSRPRGVLIGAPDAELLWHRNLDFVLHYGPIGFSATDNDLEAIEEEDVRKPLEAMSTLEELLSSTSDDDVLCGTNTSSHQGGAEQVVKKISELKENNVVLYLCINGRFHLRLLSVQQACIDQGIPFEVVVCFIPRRCNMEYRSFMSLIEDSLQKWKITWWRLPPEKSFKLWRLHERTMVSDPCDRLISVGSQGSFVDTHAEELLHWWGVSAYPFSRKLMVLNHVEQLRKLTLESLLGPHDGLLHGLGCKRPARRRFSVSELRDKNVLLFLLCGPVRYADDVYLPVTSCYEELKEIDPDLKVIVVCLVKKPGLQLLPQDSSWLVCPYDSVRSPQLASKLFFKHMYSTLVAFDKDGKISALHVEKLLENSGLNTFPFKSDLRQDVFQLLVNSCPFPETMYKAKDYLFNDPDDYVNSNAAVNLDAVEGIPMDSSGQEGEPTTKRQKITRERVNKRRKRK